jgi:hypothetical protein
MSKAGSVRRVGDDIKTALWFAARPPQVQGKRSTYVPFDPEESKAVLVSTTTEHINRENAKAELMAALQAKRLKEKDAHIQAAYDWLCGRKTP